MNKYLSAMQGVVLVYFAARDDPGALIEDLDSIVRAVEPLSRALELDRIETILGTEARQTMETIAKLSDAEMLDPSLSDVYATLAKHVSKVDRSPRGGRGAGKRSKRVGRGRGKARDGASNQQEKSA